MSNLPIGYLISTLLLAWCVYFVLAPSDWPRPFKSLSSYFGVMNELPFLGFFWLLGSTWLAFINGDIYSPVGWLIFGVAVIAAAGLILIIYRGIQDAPLVKHHLDESLPEGWRNTIEPEIANRLQKNIVGQAFLGPFIKRPYNVERIADIRYGDAGVRNLLDVYRHRSHPTGSPVLVHFHGGRFSSGRKSSQSLPLIHQLASQGWVCISANYRLSPAAKFPEHLIDAKKVIAWVREHGAEFGADPAAIFIAGNSSGAHMAAMAALTPNDPTYQPGFEKADTSVIGVICQYGYYGSISNNRDKPSAPMAYSGKDAPPFLITHGSQDKIVPVAHARLFSEHLRHSSTHPVVYVEFPYAEHNIDLFHSIRAEATIHGIEAFAAWVLAKNKQDAHLR